MLAKINDELEKHNDILLYDEDLFEYYNKRNKKQLSIYISTPRKGKIIFEQILKTLENDAVTKNKTISSLIEEINEKSLNKQLYIYLDSFEQLSKRDIMHYKQLQENKNIHLIVNIKEDKEFTDEKFLKNFIILNESEFKSNRSQSVNITYSLLLLLSLLIFLMFLRIQLSMLSYLINALWFTLLMYRSIYYITK